jgi:MFS family permease
VFYANGLFSSQVISARLSKPDADDSAAVVSYLVDLAAYQLALSCLALPGYFISVFVIDRIGRRRLQLIGFLGMALCYAAVGIAEYVASDSLPLFFFLYGLSFLFCNAGPNVTTFVIPSELFPTAIRATCHGLSAAAGKVGAVIGGALMPHVLSGMGLSGVMFISALISVLGWLFTYFLTVESQHLEIMSARESENVAAIIRSLQSERFDTNNHVIVSGVPHSAGSRAVAAAERDERKAPVDLELQTLRSAGSAIERDGAPSGDASRDSSMRAFTIGHDDEDDDAIDAHVLAEDAL